MATDLHVVMIPWSAFGHMIPFFQLSLELSKAGIRVSYVSTPKNIQRLPPIPQNLANLFRYIPLPLPAVDGLPEGAEATVDISFDQIPYLKKAYDLLKEPFRQLILNHSTDWVIADLIPHWSVDVAKDCNVPLIYFSVYNAATWSFVGPPEYLVGEGQKRLRSSPEALLHAPPWISFQSPLAARNHEAKVLHLGLYGENASGIKDAERFAKISGGCQAMVVRDCSEFDGEYIDLFSSITHKTVIPTGLLLPPSGDDKESISDASWRKSFKWMDEQESRSVVFVGFGSEYKLTREEVYEIGHGLELSQLPFVWALRRPTWAKEDLSDAFPPGFKDRTAGKGIVCLGWAPQHKILAHRAVGGSLFHSGWGSVIETLQYGHTLVLLPFIVDQGLNARLLVDKSLAVEVDRKEDGSYTREEVAKALSKAMVEAGGETIRKKCREAAVVFGNQKLQEQYFTGFVEYLRDGTRPARVANISDF